MNDALSQFRDAIRAAGLEPPDVIESGKLHRFPGIGKRNGNTAGWCKLFDDGLGGCFGDWSSGSTENWQAKREKPLSRSEREAFMRRVEETRKRAEAERQQQFADAAEKAVTIWSAATPAHDDHPYLVRKGIKAGGARLHQGALVVPVRSGGELHSLQFIAEDGAKRFLRGGRITGGYFSIGTVKGAEALCIAEGFATGATIHQATGYPIAVAFNAGNLEPVAKAMREHFSKLPLIICADDDVSTEGNPGITKANHAAKATRAKLALPSFGEPRPEGVTDFNDMAALVGLDAVAHIIKEAAIINHESMTSDNEWPRPLPLSAKVEPEPYPLDALPETVRAAVEEVRAFTKAPIPLVASSALAALSLVVQAHADVKRAEKLTGPVGLFLLTIAESGERKSTCDGFFMQEIRDYEANQAEGAKPLVKDFNATKEAWEAKRGGIKEKIRSLAKMARSTHEQEAALRDLEHDKPEPPRVPRLIYGDATPEALKWNLAMGWPAGGVVS
jgi:putative DNA primase/helicase